MKNKQSAILRIGDKEFDLEKMAGEFLGEEGLSEFLRLLEQGGDAEASRLVELYGNLAIHKSNSGLMVKVKNWIQHKYRMTFQTGPDSQADVSAIRPRYEAAKKAIEESFENENNITATLMNAGDALQIVAQKERLRKPSGKTVDYYDVASRVQIQIGSTKKATPAHLAKLMVSKAMDVSPNVVAREIGRTPQNDVVNYTAWSGRVGPLDMSEPSKKQTAGIMIGQDMNRKHKKGPG